MITRIQRRGVFILRERYRNRYFFELLSLCFSLLIFRFSSVLFASLISHHCASLKSKRVFTTVLRVASLEEIRNCNVTNRPNHFLLAFHKIHIYRAAFVLRKNLLDDITEILMVILFNIVISEYIRVCVCV